MAVDHIVMRPFEADDTPGVLALLGACMGWEADDRHATLFRWKHLDNPFGPSYAWVAVTGGLVVGFRAFLRWEFVRDDTVVVAARAVDTATHPDYRRRHVFRRLTLSALDELADHGVEFVFNTPSDRSLPGYLGMGWQVVGRLPVSARPRSVLGLARMARSRVPANRWPVATVAGVAAEEALRHRTLIERLLGTTGASGMTTRRSVAHLTWRYAGLPALGYRAIIPGEPGDEGLGFFRLRRRGAAIEAAIAEVLVARGDRSRGGRIAALAIKAAVADYGIAIGRHRLSGFAPLPRQGPLLTGRPLTGTALPAPSEWDLTLGDVELF